MNEITHTELVSALAKDGADILKTLTPEKCHLLHMAVGVAGEAGELSECTNVEWDSETLDVENLIEELGDTHFYIEGLVQAGVGIKYTQVEYYEESKTKAEYLSQCIFECGSQVLDFVKKHVIYNKELPVDDINKSLEKLSFYVSILYSRYNLTHEQVLQANINKLKVRYEGLTYSDQAAQQRADKS